MELDRARGRSWEARGADLGITRQAAHERFARRLGENLPVSISPHADGGRLSPDAWLLLAPRGPSEPSPRCPVARNAC